MYHFNPFHPLFYWLPLSHHRVVAFSWRPYVTSFGSLSQLMKALLTTDFDETSNLGSYAGWVERFLLGKFVTKQIKRCMKMTLWELVLANISQKVLRQQQTDCWLKKKQTLHGVKPLEQSWWSGWVLTSEDLLPRSLHATMERCYVATVPPLICQSEKAREGGPSLSSQQER